MRIFMMFMCGCVRSNAGTSQLFGFTNYTDDSVGQCDVNLVENTRCISMLGVPVHRLCVGS